MSPNAEKFPITQLSSAGDAVLVQEEGDVLRAYRCPAGVWTISTGLTAASGVVKPVKGMTITPGESQRLRRLALAKNYEPAVARALPTTIQHVFDGGVLFHWNTGAIARATWVEKFLNGAAQQAKASFLSWNKAGGKVWPGLTKRRHREWNIIEFGRYGTTLTQPSAISEFADHVHDFRKLGFDTAKGAVTTVVAFQRAHGLTEDGIIGPATRAAISRALSVKSNNGAAKGGAVAGGAGGAGTDLANPAPANQPDASGASVDLDILLWVGGGAIGIALAVLAAGWIWRNRGPLFAWLPEGAKDFFENRGLVLGRRVRT